MVSEPSPYTCRGLCPLTADDTSLQTRDSSTFFLLSPRRQSHMTLPNQLYPASAHVARMSQVWSSSLLLASTLLNGLLT